jgi:hypothetical protein
VRERDHQVHRSPHVAHAETTLLPPARRRLTCELSTIPERTDSSGFASGLASVAGATLGMLQLVSSSDDVNRAS